MHEVEKYIRSIKDFPEEGIIFRDITTVIQDPKGRAKRSIVKSYGTIATNN